jgi:hypothetical protein
MRRRTSVCAWTTEVVSKWVIQQRSSIAPSLVRAMLSCIQLMCNPTPTRAVSYSLEVVLRNTSHSSHDRSIWLAGSRSDRAERMSIARSPDVSWRLGNH